MGVAKGVANFDAKLDRIRARTVIDGDGWERYRGQDRKGRQTTASLNKQDLTAARHQLAKAEAGLDVVYSEAHGDTPRIQKREAEHAAMSEAVLACRLVLDAARRCGLEVTYQSLMGGEPDDDA